jgi:hypothetical protein
MGCDYLAIPATSCITECSFSMSGHTDDPRRGSMHPLKFGSLQKLHMEYLNGQINVDLEIMMKYIGDFDFDEDDYAE